MNAHFTLTKQPASSLLTRLDMSDQENAKDALAGLIAAGNDVAKLAVWAGRWGNALCERCLSAEGEIIAPETVDELESDLRSEEARVADLEKAIRAAAKAVDQLLEREGGSLSSRHFTQISSIGDHLEAAL